MKSTFTLLLTVVIALLASYGIYAQGPKSNMVVEINRTDRGAIIAVYGKTGDELSLPTLKCDFAKSFNDGLCHHLRTTIGANNRVKVVYAEGNKIGILTEDYYLYRAEIAMVVDIVTAAFDNNGVVDRNRPAYFSEDGYAVTRFKGLPTKVQNWTNWLDTPEKIQQSYERPMRPSGRIPTTAKDVQEMCKANPSNCVATRDRVIRDKP